MRKFSDELKKRLQDPGFAERYNEEKLLIKLGMDIANMREKKGMTQKAFAAAIKSTQQQVSAWEQGNITNIELKSLEKIAHALGKRVEVRLV